MAETERGLLQGHKVAQYTHILYTDPYIRQTFHFRNSQFPFRTSDDWVIVLWH